MTSRTTVAPRRYDTFSVSIFRRILVPTAMRELDELALRYALYFHETLGSAITLLHARWMPPDYHHPLGYALDHASEPRRATAETLRDYARAKISPSARVETTVIDDSPARAIVETADHLGADLIVMATHGRHGLDRALHGSVTERVRRATTRPVLTVTPRLFESSRGIAVKTILCSPSPMALEHGSELASALGAKLEVLSAGAEPRVLEIAERVAADLIVSGYAQRIGRFAAQPVLTVARRVVSVHNPSPA